MKNYMRNILLYDHFCGPGHEMSHCKFQIIFHVKTDDDTKDVLMAKEEYYMRMLSTLPVWLEWLCEIIKYKSQDSRFYAISWSYYAFLFLYTASQKTKPWPQEK